MLRRKLLVVMLFALTACSDRNPGIKEGFSFPPEWYPHRAVMMDWTNLGCYTPKMEIIKAIHDDVQVYIVTHSDSLAVDLREKLILEKIDTSRIRIFYDSVPAYFIRDSGPKFLVNGAQMRIADFDWNCYGFEDYGESCYKRRETVRSLASILAMDMVSSDVVVEGGGLEVNESSILAFRQMAETRNPGKGLEAVGKEILRVYGKQRMVWINETPPMDISGSKGGNYFGMGANGHIDEYMRFVNDSTLLVSVVDSMEIDGNVVMKSEAAALQRNLEQIRQVEYKDGRKFNIITVPVPNVILYGRRSLLTSAEKTEYPKWYMNFMPGDTIIQLPIMSYLNFLVTNNTVLISKYWREGIPASERVKDEYVFNLFSKVFPGRRIVQIDPIELNWWGGGIHCSTQQVPETRPD